MGMIQMPSYPGMAGMQPQLQRPPGYAAGPGAPAGGNVISGYGGSPAPGMGARPPGYAAGPGAPVGGNVIGMGMGTPQPQQQPQVPGSPTGGPSTTYQVPRSSSAPVGQVASQSMIASLPPQARAALGFSNTASSPAQIGSGPQTMGGSAIPAAAPPSAGLPPQARAAQQNVMPNPTAAPAGPAAAGAAPRQNSPTGYEAMNGSQVKDFTGMWFDRPYNTTQGWYGQPDGTMKFFG